MKHLFLIIACVMGSCLWASGEEIDDTWLEYRVPFGETAIALKLPYPPVIWETEEGRKWVKCETDTATFFARLQTNPLPKNSTRVIRKYIKANPPFDGYECVGMTFQSSRKKIIVDTTWKSKSEIVKEKHIFSDKDFFSFFAVYSSQVSPPPHLSYFNSIIFPVKLRAL